MSIAFTSMSMVAFFAAIAATVIAAANVLLILFLGLLLGIFLTKCSDRIEPVIRFRYEVRLTIVTTLLLLVLAATLFGLGTSIDQQLQAASSRLDSSLEKVERWLRSKPAIFDSIKQLPFSDELFLKDQEESSRRSNNQSAAKIGSNERSINSVQSDDADDPPEKSSTKDAGNSKGDSSSLTSLVTGDSQVTGSVQTPEVSLKKTTGDAVGMAAGRVVRTFQKMLSTTFGLVANIGIIFFVGVFLAVDPSLYRDGVANLFPADRRDRIIEVMNLTSDSMFNWIVGRFIAMLLTGIGTAITLAVLGVPMSISIGIATGILTFIPNIGGFIALILASLMALTQGPSTVVWVVIAYGAIQLVESNIITPMIQQYQTSIPPALLLSFQLVFGILNGFLGIMVATPLLAAILPAVKELWIEDVLGGGTGENTERQLD